MWFKLNTTFTQSLGTLSSLSNSWSITRNLTNFSTDSTVTSVAKDGSYSATFKLNDGCTYSSHSVTMGGATVTSGVSYSNGTLTVSISKVTGAVVITAVATGASSGGSGGDSTDPTPDDTTRTTDNSHANVQTLPSSITSTTNLIGTISQTDGQYYLSSGWGTATNISSITFPVIPGDRISGNVFGTKTENGSSINGTRTCFLNNDTIVSNVSPTDIYTEYTTNGYITVPAGCNCISIPFTTSAVSTHNLNIYLLSV